jgi:hypothetical protein
MPQQPALARYLPFPNAREEDRPNGARSRGRLSLELLEAGAVGAWIDRWLQNRGLHGSAPVLTTARADQRVGRGRGNLMLRCGGGFGIGISTRRAFKQGIWRFIVHPVRGFAWEQDILW